MNKTMTHTGQYLTFTLADETFGVDVLCSREVLDVIDITKVPQTPDFMLGVINLRGSVVPVIDLRLKFAIEKAPLTRDSCIIVLELALDGETTKVGILADSVQEVLDLDIDQIEPPPKIGTRLKMEFIQGMGKQGEEFIILLDINRIFSSEEIALVHTVIEETAEA